MLHGADVAQRGGGRRSQRGGRARTGRSSSWRTGAPKTAYSSCPYRRWLRGRVPLRARHPPDPADVGVEFRAARRGRRCSPGAEAQEQATPGAIRPGTRLNVVTSISRRKYFVDETYPTRSSIATPEHVALERGVTVGRRVEQHEHDPAERDGANTRARGSMYSLNSHAPTGTIRNGASDRSARRATLLCVAPAKNTARFRPKNTPGHERLRTSRIVIRRPCSRAWRSRRR